ncbi:hypothetical protein [Tenacibaculum bernardetii]|uniref:hypothetical protein n=1 Tax=Tenacibaculum bernardetii TaxID=3021375 RepID=UPI0023B11129|nr:hypothetical protein [Tenacibaculum bernardetii]
MNEISRNIQKEFYKVWSEKELLPNFEKWIYESTELKDNLNSNSYYEFLSFNYKKENSHSELKKLIENQISQSEVEKWKITKDLLNAKNRTKNYSKSIRNFYTLYCKGYDFMDNLAFNYSLALECPYSYYRIETFEKLSEKQKLTLIENCYPDIIGEIEKVLNWIENEKVVLIGKTNEFGKLEYIDNRTDLEKNNYKEINETVEKGKWWEFWK